MDRSQAKINITKMEELFKEIAPDLGIDRSVIFFEPYWTLNYEDYFRDFNRFTFIEDKIMGIYFFLPKRLYAKWQNKDMENSNEILDNLSNIVMHTHEENLDKIGIVLTAFYKNLPRRYAIKTKKYQKEYEGNNNVYIEVSNNNIFVCAKLTLTDISAYEAFKDLGSNLVPWLEDAYCGMGEKVF